MTTTFQAIEEIDISSLFKPTDLHSSEVDALIANALASDGAFVATGLPCSNRLDEEMSNLMRFFDLPLEMKLRCATKSYEPANPNNYRGYYPLPETPDWAYKEGFDIGPEPALSCPDIPGALSFRESNVWPNEADLPEWRSEMLDQLQQLRTLETLLMAAIARGLDLAPEPFLIASYGRNATLRLLSRPTLPKKFRFAVLDEGDDGQKKALKSQERRKSSIRIMAVICWRTTNGRCRWDLERGISPGWYIINTLRHSFGSSKWAPVSRNTTSCSLRWN